MNQQKEKNFNNAYSCRDHKFIIVNTRYHREFTHLPVARKSGGAIAGAEALEAGADAGGGGAHALARALVVFFRAYLRVGGAISTYTDIRTVHKVGDGKKQQLNTLPFCTSVIFMMYPLRRVAREGLMLRMLVRSLCRRGRSPNSVRNSIVIARNDTKENA